MTQASKASLPPPLTDEQRAAARVKSLEVRQARARLRAQLAAGEVTWQEAWRDDRAQGMRVYQLLTALPGVGRGKALAWLAEAGIRPDATVRACGVRQTEKLFRRACR